MLNKLVAFCKAQDLLHKGDRIVCAVSGGADSMALLWAMYLLKDTWQLDLAAAHYNHGLRGEESDRDAAFVAEFCDRFSIPLYMEKGQVTAGKKGLEAAARDARYGFFRTLPGKLATAHTADDNAETVLMHLVRGTGLKGLGGIAPSRENLIRPMLGVTRAQVLAFLEEYHISYITDSSNLTDSFLRNRIRHHVMPLLCRENPQFAANTSDMALRLRLEEQVLEDATPDTDRVAVLRQLDSAMRSRALRRLLEKLGVKEPASEHIALVESLVFSDNPSAVASLPGGVEIRRNYDRLQTGFAQLPLQPAQLPNPGQLRVGQVRILCEPARQKVFTTDHFTVSPVGKVVVRSRQPGDKMRLFGGTKTLKELFIDRKIPAAQRMQIPVLADDAGVLGVYGLGANLDRVSESGIQIRFEKIEKEEK